MLAFTAGSAQAQIRTGEVGSDPAFPADPPSAEMPGIDRLEVRHDESDGTVRVTFDFASPVADPQTTSALRSTDTWFRLGRFWGEVNPYGRPTYEPCTSEFAAGGWLYLATGQAQMDLDLATEDAADLVAGTLQLSSDRRQGTATFGPDDRLRSLNAICLTGGMYAPSGPDSGRLHRLEHQLLDGFRPQDGDIGDGAERFLRNELRWVVYRYAARATNEYERLPGERVRCSPQRSPSASATCTASATLRDVRGRPRITIRSALSYDPFSINDPSGKPTVDLNWWHRSRVRLDLPRCLKRISRAKARARKPCSVSFLWRNGPSDPRSGTLDQDVVARLGKARRDRPV